MPSLLTTLSHVGRGLLMGTADVIPGVSGGTVALILGIYERFVSSVGAAAAGAFRTLRLDRAGARRRFGEVEWALVLPLGVGIATALAIGSRVIPVLLDEYPEQIRALFFGLIVGSLAIPFRRIGPVRRQEWVLIAACAVLAFVLVGLPPREIADPPLYLVFVLAAVAICAMILPGVSGAFLLLAFGIYEATLEAVSHLNLPYILTFLAGAALGLGLFSQVLRYLLAQRHATTMAALVGLMAGSLRALWPWQTDDRSLLAPPDGPTFLAMAALAVIGVVLVSVVAWLARPRIRVEALPN
jgi:putative membrane protein